jgi:hypothetical protein
MAMGESVFLSNKITTVYAMGVFLWGIPALAKEKVPTEDFQVKLQSIQKIHTQEANGDELYFSVTEFPAKERGTHYQVPTYPTHWLSQYVDKIKNVVLWQKTITGCQDVTVLISLVEEDIPPWNVDDLLGSVELKIKCKEGKFTTQWVIPNTGITSKIRNDAFSFTGSNAEYHAVFRLENGKSKVRILNQKQPSRILKPTYYLQR